MSAAFEHALFEWLAATAWQVAVLVLVVLALQVACRRMLTPRWRMALWAIVAVRLVVPAIPEVSGGALDPAWPARVLASGGPDLESERDRAEAPSPRSPGAPARNRVPAADPATRSEGSEDPESDTASPTETGVDAAPAGSVGPTRPRPETGAGASLSDLVHAGAAAGGPAVPDRNALEATDLEATDLEATDRDATDRAGPGPTRHASWVVRIWLAVAVALLLGLAWIELRFRRVVARAPTPGDPGLDALLDEVRRDVGLRRPVEIRVVAGLSSPAVTGLRRPRLLVPEDALRGFSDEERRCVLLHELAHLRRHDVLWNAVLGVLQCLWWFHPLVHVAFARLRQERESARDFEALRLGGASGDASVRYARTLLKLVERRPIDGRAVPALGFLDGGSDLKRRIVMITEYPRLARRHGLVLGVGLVALAGWAGFTQASPPPLEGVGVAPGPKGPAPAAPGERKRIHVERQSAPPAWRAALDARLDATVTFSFAEVPFADAVESLAQSSGVSIVMMADAMDRVVGEGVMVTAQSGDMPLREALDLICALTDGLQGDDLQWCVTREVVAIGEKWGLPEATEVRFYNIGPMFREFPEVQSDDVIQIVRELTDEWDGAWDMQGVLIDEFNGLLVVQQTERGHAAVLEALEFVLNRGRKAPAAPPQWKARTAEALAMKTDLRVEDQDAEDVARYVSTMTGLPVVFEQPEHAIEPVTMNLQGVTVAAVLDWLATALDTRVHLVDGTIRLGETGGQDVRIFEIADVAFSRRAEDGERADMSDRIVDMVMGLVDPDSWDMDPRNSIWIWQGMMIVRQTPENLDRIGDLLDSMRRALGPG